MPTRIESRITKTDVVPEAVLGTMPSGATAKWRTLDLNSYSDANVSYEQTARSVMTAGRGLKKGAQTDMTANFGYNIDNTGDNVLAQMCAFLYNTPRETTTRSILNGAAAVSQVANAIVSSTATTITATTTLAATLAANDIIILVDGQNNRIPLKVVSVATVTVTFAVLNATDVFSPVATMPADARIVKVGRVFTESLTLTGFTDKVTLVAATTAWSTFNLKVGEWIHVGGDNTFFATAQPFYARISAISGTTLTFDATTRPISTTAANATNVEVFYGTFVTDGSTVTSFTHARYFGKDDDGKHMRELYTGSIPSEMALNLEEKALVTCDFSYMCLGGSTEVMDDATHAAQFATVYPEYKGEAMNTATDIVRQRMVIQQGTVNPAAIHGFIKNGTINVNNNLTLDSAQGVLGAIGASAGDFTATGSITAYFVSAKMRDAIRCNCTVSMDLIAARKNSGFVMDMPAFTLGNGAITAEKGSSVTIDLDQAAFESTKGYTLSYTNFHYLPDSAMPTGTSGCDC